jgi:putative membrane protein
MIKATLVTVAVVALATPAWSQQTPALPTHEFVKVAAQTDEFERREGHLAATQGGSPRVRDFGQMMVTDHTKTTEALKAALKKAGMPVPPLPPLSHEQTQNVAKLHGLHGADFDKAYIAEQVSVHEKALGVMQGYSAGGENAVLRKAAADTVPVVQHHLEMARQIQGGG